MGFSNLGLGDPIPSEAAASWNRSGAVDPRESNEKLLQQDDTGTMSPGLLGFGSCIQAATSGAKDASPGT